MYLVLALLITAGMRWLERRAAARLGRTPRARTPGSRFQVGTAS